MRGGQVPPSEFGRRWPWRPSRSLDESPRHHVEPRQVARGDVHQCTSLDGPQDIDGGPGSIAAASGQTDEERSSIGLVESAKNQPPGLESIEDAAQGGRAVTEAALQLSDGMRRAIGEQRKHVRLALRYADVSQERLKSHARGMGRPLQFNDQKGRGPCSMLPRAPRSCSIRHRATRYYEME